MPATVPVSCTAVTPGSRPIMPGAATGSSAVAPEKVCPLVTVSRLVPSLAISPSSPAWEEAARPRTATIAAMPIAMPSADRAARSLRVRSPMLARPARSEGRSRAADGAAGRTAAPMWWSLSVLPWNGRPRVGDDVPVEHVDAPPRAGGDRVVVGDDDDRRPGCVEFLQQAQDRTRRWRSRGCRWARRPAAPAGRRRWRGRSRPAAVPRPTAGSAGRRPGAPARPGPARRRPAAAARRGGPRRTAARRPRCRARSGARRGRTAGTRTRSAMPAAPPAPGRSSGPRPGR